MTVVWLSLLLVLPWLLTLGLARWSSTARRLRPVAPRLGLACVFLVTGISHFTRTDELAAMLPPDFPERARIVHATGVLELAGAIGLLVPRCSRVAAAALIVFLIAVFPANIWAAFHRTGPGIHVAGPIYLLVRGPFQLLLIAWAWLGCLRAPRSPTAADPPPRDSAAGLQRD